MPPIPAPMPYGPYRGVDVADVPTAPLEAAADEGGLCPWLAFAVGRELRRRREAPPTLFGDEPPPEGYAGWLRADGGPWRAVCRADDSASCWSLLLDAPSEGRTVDRAVLPAGTRPDRRRR